MVQWELNSKHPTTAFGKIVRRHISTTDGQNVDNMISAYDALLKGRFTSADDVRRSFTRNGQPLFSTEQAASVYKKVRSQAGGAAVESILNTSIQKALDVAAGITEPGPPNPAIQSAIKSVQMVIRTVLPFVFILNTLENSPLFGDIIGASLDITAATLPVIAGNIQTITPAIVGLLPLPEAGPIGILIGWLFSLWFLWLAAVIAMSRKDFAGALEATAGMVPVLGPALMRTVKSVETVSTKFYNRADRISESISRAFGSVKGALQDVSSKLKSAPGLDTFAGPNPPGIKLPSIADIKSSVTSAMPPALTPAPAPAPAPVPAPAPIPSPLKSTLPPPMKTSFSPMKTRRGGKRRFKRTKRTTKKWTRRR